MDDNEDSIRTVLLVSAGLCLPSLVYATMSGLFWGESVFYVYFIYFEEAPQSFHQSYFNTIALFYPVVLIPCILIAWLWDKK